jgi:Uncharacterized protein conserved in bacteria
MITGYLLLDREYDTERYSRFLKQKWLHLLLCTWIWYAIYELFNILYQGTEITLIPFLEDLLFVHTIGMGSAWYMPMILGMYLLIPLVANALKTVDFRCLRLPLLVFGIYTFGVAFFDVISNALLGEALSLKFSTGFSGGTYGIYILLGYLIKNGSFKKVHPTILLLLVFASIGAGALFQMWSYAHEIKYNIWYDSPIILVGSTSIFVLLSRIKFSFESRVTSFMSYHSFGVYLVHLMILRIIKPRIHACDMILPLKVLLLWALSLVITYALVWLISRIPKVGKYILYEK